MGLDGEVKSTVERREGGISRRLIPQSSNRFLCIGVRPKLMAHFNRTHQIVLFGTLAVLAACFVVVDAKWRPFWIARHLNALKHVKELTQVDEKGQHYIDGDAIQDHIDALTKLGYYEHGQVSLPHVPPSRSKEISKKLVPKISTFDDGYFEMPAQDLRRPQPVTVELWVRANKFQEVERFLRDEDTAVKNETLPAK